MQVTNALDWLDVEMQPQPDSACESSSQAVYLVSGLCPFCPQADPSNKTMLPVEWTKPGLLEFIPGNIGEQRVTLMVCQDLYFGSTCYMTNGRNG